MLPLLIDNLKRKNQGYFCIHSKDIKIKESCNLIGWEDFGLKLVKKNFPRKVVYTGKQTTVRSFILSYFQQKVMKEFYEN